MKTAMKGKRRFSSAERIALYLSGGGICAGCHMPLVAGWHADHVHAYVRGGVTDVLNGQALCPSCNLSKGVKDFMPTVPTWPREVVLRQWQEVARERYEQLRETKNEFLFHVTPGAGKTIFALFLASWELARGRIERVVVVVPTTHLRGQWAKEAARVGIDLDPEVRNVGASPEARDFHGAVVTYAQVASQPQLHRAFCRRPTLVILDEPHHMGTDLSWGNRVQEAFEGSAVRIGITGTAFRSDNQKIPFVQYEPTTRRSAADFTYGYGAALADHIVRPVYFPSFEGRMRWWTSKNGEVEAAFREELPEEERTRRLRTALLSEEWLGEVLREANSRLVDIRRQEGSEDAAGLVLAMDQAHARQIAKLLTSISGTMPEVAISDDNDASDVIDRFKRGRSPWIVAVRMVSEGVDIPRLSVGVYATNVLTELFFRQVIGRFIRRRSGIDGENGWLFIPRDPTLVGFVQSIKEERDHVLAEEREKERAERQETLAGMPSGFTPLSAEATPDDVFIDQQAFDQVALSEARSLAESVGLEGIADVIVARIIRRRDEQRGAVVSSSSPAVEQQPEVRLVQPLRDRKRERTAIIRRLVSEFVGRTGMDYPLVNGLLKIASGLPQGDETFDGLVRRIELLEEWLDMVDSAASPTTYREWEALARRVYQYAH